jgi:hypothetical protein
MPAHAKAPHLVFKRANAGSGGYWIIKDGGRRISTGIRVARRGKPPPEAERALADHLISTTRGRDLDLHAGKGPRPCTTA